MNVAPFKMEKQYAPLPNTYSMPLSTSYPVNVTAEDLLNLGDTTHNLSTVSFCLLYVLSICTVRAIFDYVATVRMLIHLK